MLLKFVFIITVFGGAYGSCVFNTFLKAAWISWMKYVFGFFLILCSLSYLQMTLTRTARMVNQLPQGKKFPLIGSLHNFFCKPERIINRISAIKKEYGPIFGFWIAHKPYVIITDAQIVQKVLSSSKCNEKGEDYKSFRWLFGDGLVTSKMDIWRQDRRLINPAFKFDMLAKYRSSFNNHSKTLIQILEKKFDNSANFENLKPYFCRLAIDSISESALGKYFNVQTNPDSKFPETADMCLESFRTRLFKPWMTFPLLRDISGLAKREADGMKFFSDLFVEVIEKRREILRNNVKLDETEKVPFIDLLVEFKSDKQILDHVITMFGAGFESTATAVNYTMFLIALHPDIQEKVFQELEGIFGGDIGRDITLADLTEMKYLEMCIKESMRLYPPVPFMIRLPDEDILLDNGYTIPKGCNVGIGLYELHRDKNYFPDPETYNPERFRSNACQDLNPYAYIPFSIGPRNCIGQKYTMLQVKTVLSKIFHRFKVTTATTKREDLKLLIGMVLQLAEPILFQLEKR